MKLLYSDNHPQSTKSLERLSRLTVPEKSIYAALLLAQKTNYQSEASIEGLQKGLDSKYNKFDDCVNALDRIGGERAGKCLLDALNRETNDPARQSNLIRAIGRAKYIEAIPTLLSMLSVITINVNVQDAIIIALGDIRHPDAFSTLLDIAKDIHQMLGVRRQAIESLGKNRHPDSVKELVKMTEDFDISQVNDYQIIDWVVNALTLQNNNEADLALRQSLTNPYLSAWHPLIGAYFDTKPQST